MPSPRPKPTKLKILEGNRGKRALNRHEPEPALGIPNPPDWFDADSRSIWDRIVPELDRLGLLTVVDGAALEGACSAYATAVQCRRILQRDGLVCQVGNQGYRQQRPEVSIEQKAWAQFRAFCIEFGLTPASRTRLSVSGKQEADPLKLAMGKSSTSETQCSSVQ